jgi:hypothetical protein
MYRLGLALSAILVYATVAQAQTISVPTFVVDPGASINVTVTGTPGHNYALIGSITNSGFSYAGVNLAVGVDVVILAFGVLDSAGQAVVPFRPPFPTRDRYYLQAATSTNPNFIPLAPGNSISLINSELARLQIPIGGIISANGAAAFLSSGVTVTRTGPGVYQIDHPGLLGIPTPVPNVTVIGGATISTLATNANRTVVTLSTDAAFFFTIQAVRR